MINLIIAGPGTGKTKALIDKWIELIFAKNIDPNKVAIFSFSRKSAKNIKSSLLLKLKELSGIRNNQESNLKQLRKTLERLHIRTLDSLLRKVVLESDKYRGFEIGDEESCKIAENILKQKTENKAREKLDEAFRGRGVYFWEFLTNLKLLKKKESRNLNSKDVLDIYKKTVPDYWREADKSDIGYEKLDKALDIQEIEKCIKEYNDGQSNRRVYDLEELGDKALEILQTEELARRHWIKEFEAILVDEFQDLDKLRFEILKILIGNRGRKMEIWMAGDPDQSIYGFRGGIKDVDCIKEVFSEIGIKEAMHLEMNYRNTPQILEAANIIIKRNYLGSHKRKELKVHKTKGEGAEVKYILADNHEKEIEYVCRGIWDLIYNKKVDPEEICILYRRGKKGARVEKLKKALEVSNIPFRYVDKSDVEVWADKYKPGAEESEKRFINLMTIHKGKGGEWDYVFVVFMDCGVFPSLSSNDSKDISEERRLAYVAFTRTKLGLTLSSGSRNRSIFLRELGVLQ